MEIQDRPKDILKLLKRIDNGYKPTDEETQILNRQTIFTLDDMDIYDSVPRAIDKLVNLKKFDCAHCWIHNLPESIGNLSNLEHLDLSRTEITALPESLGKLSNLEHLDLSSTKITALPESLGKLSNLQTLDCIDTSITNLPESIGNLSNLEHLDLRRTKITALPESLGKLSNLQTLDCSNTSITNLPESIGNLFNLEHLDLSETRLTALPKSIGKLDNLRILNLSSTKITALPESLGKLSNLKALFLFETRIDIISDDFSLPAELRTLVLGAGSVSFADCIRQLSDLEVLCFQIEDYTDISFLRELRKLKVLCLGDISSFSIGREMCIYYYNRPHTSITVLPDWLGNLPALEHLDLSGLTIPIIPESLALRGLPFVSIDHFFCDMRGVNLKDVTLTMQDRSIFLEHPELIPSLYKKEDLIPVRECRIIFLGDGVSGKSYTIKRFRNKGKKETKKNPYATCETPGVEILDYHVNRGEDSFDVHFWDFGGQQLLHSMHRCFLSEDSCYVVTVKTRETKANDRARYWLRNVTAFAPKSPVLLFVNCWEDDNGRRAIDEPGLRKEFPMIREVTYCSAKQALNAEFCDKVINPIIEMAVASVGCTKRVPQQWIAVRNAIEKESRENNYLTKAQYHDLCKENNIENYQAPELLSFFNSLGVCFSYHQDEHKQELEEYKLLSPVWLTNALYAIIEEGMAPAQDGKITKRCIQNMLCNPAPAELDGKPHRRTVPDIVYKRKECPWLLAVAEAHDLCYQVDAKTLFFPSLCSTDTPKEALNPPTGYPQHVSYLLRYTYLPDSVLHQLMIRCMRNNLSVGSCWLKGMVLKVWNLHQAFVRMADEESLRIDIYSAGTQPAYELFWLLRKEICAVNFKLNLRAEEFILDGKDEFPMEAILEAAKDNAPVYGRSGKRSPNELLNRFYEISVWQSMNVENGMLHIPIPSREYHRRSKSNRALRYALYMAYNQICPYCSNPISNIRQMEVDHILPSKYPHPAALKPYVDYLVTCGFDINKPDYIENYFPSHHSCNDDKNNRVNEYSLPYWHDIAAQHVPKVMQLMKQYNDRDKFVDDSK